MKVIYSALFFILLHGIAHAQCEDFVLTVTNVQPPSCPNSADGAISLSVAGAQGTVSYAWSEAGLITPTIDGLAPGTYSVTATDFAGCEAVETVVLAAAVVADAGEDPSQYCGEGAVTLGGSVLSPVSFAEQGVQTIEFYNALSEQVSFDGTPGGVFIGPVRDTAEYTSNNTGVSMQLGNLSGQPGEQVYLPIYVGQGFQDMAAFQFGVSFDTTILELTGMVIPTNTLPNFGVPTGDPPSWPQGFFLISWNSPDPLIGHSLPDGHLLALLQFTVTGASVSTSGPNITYQWTGPDNFTSTEPFPQVSQSGAYTLRVTDTSQPDCWAEDLVEVIFQPDSIGVMLADTLTPCLSQPVVLEPEISGGQPPFSYLWSTGDTTASITVTSTDALADYSVTITSADGCTGLATARVEAENTIPPAVAASDQPFCPGSPADLRATATGGAAPYTYLWNDGFVTDNPRRIVTLTAPAAYWVSVVDANGCSSTPDTALMIEQPLSEVDLGPDRYFCTPEQVLLIARVVSGPPAISYNWNDGTAGQFTTVQPFQTSDYIVSTFNTQGCPDADTVTLFIGRQGIDVSSPLCDDNGTPNNPGDDTFTFQATVESNPGGSWVSNLGPSDFYGLPVTFGPYPIADGDVTLTVADGFDPSCTATTVVAPPAPCSVPIPCNITITATNTICTDSGTPNNPSDDSLLFTLLVEGGPGPGWVSNLGPTGSYGQAVTFGPFPIAAGDLTLTVVDAGDPSCNTTTVVPAPAPCSVTPPCTIIATATDIICTDNGTAGNPVDDTLLVILLVDGAGNGWGSNRADGSGAYGVPDTLSFALADGAFNLQVFDENDPTCSTSLLIDPAVLCAPPCNLQAVVQEIICNDNNTPADTTDDTFTLEILITGGPGSGWVEDSSGLSGEYGTPFTFGPYPADYGHVGLIFRDVDYLSCVDIFDLYTPVPCVIDCQQNPILVNFDVVFPTCFGASDGEAIAIVEGGAGGYTYQWSNGVTTSSISNLPAGDYSLAVADVLGCQATGVATLTEPPLLVLDLQATPVSCPGANDGVINVFITGGTQPYTYQWSIIGASTPVLGGLEAGVYSVTVFDANDCSVSGEVVVTEAGPGLAASIDIIQQPTCPNSNDGVLSANASGGVPTLEYIWSTGFTGPTHPGLAPGLYSIEISDANGCSIVRSILLEAVLFAEAGPDQVLDCNNPTVTLDASLSSAGPDIAYEWTGPGGLLSGLAVIEVSEPGVYTLEVTDTGQPDCFATDTVIVLAGENPPPIINISPVYVSCDSAVLFYPLTPNLAITWTLPGGGASTEPTLGVTESGDYLFTILDITNGCTASGQVSVVFDPGACATLKGRLVRDTLPDCIPAPDEPGLQNWLIAIQGDGQVYYAVTQPDGYYEQSVPIGDYEVYPILPGQLWLPCQDSYPVSLQQPGEMAILDIPVQEAEACPVLSVDVSLPILRRCWTRSIPIRYCNEGTDDAEGAYIVVTLDDAFNYQFATAPLLSQDGNQLTFDIGDVPIGGYGTLYVTVQVSCDAVVGTTLCTEAKIFPNAPCFPPSPNWSGASLQVKGACEGGEVQFRVENVGSGDMAAPRPCIVIEDGVMLLVAPDSVQLNSGEAFTYRFPANGSTYRIEVEQEPFHPGLSMPVAVLEGCGMNANGSFSTGFVNQLALDDADPFIDIECREVVGSYDPNDKHGFPRGYGAENYIYPGTDIEYLIRFQNTGNDTAFLVVIRDTLSGHLDITTVHTGAASHPYTWDIDSNNILVFTFDDILLPDSTTNLEGSQGFIEFKVSQQENLPLGTVIENSAAIYFDVNEPIITNTTIHTLGHDFVKLVSFTPQDNIPELRISVAPNPMGEWALLQLEGWPGGEGLFELYGLQGRRLREQRFSGPALRFERRGLPAGLYAFRIVDERGRWGSGRLVIR